jgi:hypothetical protein
MTVVLVGGFALGVGIPLLTAVREALIGGARVLSPVARLPRRRRCSNRRCGAV